MENCEVCGTKTDETIDGVCPNCFLSIEDNQSIEDTELVTEYYVKHLEE